MQYVKKPQRVELLDEYRGLVVLLMVIYHGCWDMVYLFGVHIPGYEGLPGALLQGFIAWSFIFISGIACRYSVSNIKRGLITVGLGMVISLSTWLFMPEAMIWFGILHFLGVSMILFGLLQPLLDTISEFAGLIICALLFAFTYSLPMGSVGLPGLFSIPLPQGLYQGHWLLPLGFGGMGSDYFPLLPWLFLFFAGAYVGQLFHRGSLPYSFYRVHNRTLGRIGRRSIVVYMLHQPALYGVLWTVFWLLAKLGLR